MTDTLPQAGTDVPEYVDRHGERHPLPDPDAERQVRSDDRTHVFHSWSAQALIDLVTGNATITTVVTLAVPAVPAVAAAFTPAQLAQQPAGWWVTNGGSVWNQRYSPLTQLDKDDLEAIGLITGVEHV